jgi:AraC-like DNA-binding protein
MERKRQIPLIQTAVVEPFILVARTIGIPVERALDSAGLPARMLDERRLIVPEIPVWKFIQEIAQTNDTPLLGLQAALLLAHQEIESVKPLIEGCVNLKGLLERICLIAPIQSNTAVYTLEEDGELVWFKQKGPRFIPDCIQVELFEIAGMMQLVQLVAGEHWRPSEIHFNSKRCRHVANAEQLNPGRILFSQRYPAIAIQRNLLPSAIPDFGPSTSKPPLLPSAVRGQLLSAVSPFLGEKLNKSRLPDITGMSFRTLQRTLNQEGTTISEIIEQARFEKAQRLLRETNEKLLDISLMLGYADGSVFSHAFKRWSGVSPREFRNAGLQ